MSYCETSNRIRCDSCGRYFKHMEKGSSWLEVPDSFVSFEEHVENCKACTDQYGKPLPFQMGISTDAYSGVIE
ncbi:hypothetical protein KAR91_41180 [Candidatus Pacearchaeota archaeon]|nr:hypothetical protein [Candidatus Pacearchaeota archaeon]